MIDLSLLGVSAALLAGKPNVGFDEVRRVAGCVLGHRLILDFSARLEDMTPARLVAQLLNSIDEVSRPLPEDLAS